MTPDGWCRLTGLAVGTGVAFALTRTYLFDLAPAVLALAVVIGLLAGEATTLRPARTRGAASLRTRQVRNYVPRRAVIVIVLLAAGVGVFSAWPTPVRADHSVEYFGTAEPVTLTSAMITLAVVAVLSALVVWAVVRSAQAGIDATEHAADEAWRRAVVQRIIQGCAAIFAAVFTAVGFWYADQQLNWRGGGSPAWGFGLSVLAAVGLVTFARYAGALTMTAQTDATDSRPRDNGKTVTGPVPR
jgi:amino acid transporter